VKLTQSIRRLMKLCDPHCKKKKIPQHLHQNGRLADPSFDRNERIYIRFREFEDNKPTLCDGKVSAAIFKTEKQSSNREKYSKSPTDVLFETNGDHKFSWGIVELMSREICETTFPHPNTETSYSFRVIHDPVQCMYPHSEIRIFENGNLVESIKPKSVKNLIKYKWREISSVLKKPS